MGNKYGDLSELRRRDDIGPDPEVIGLNKNLKKVGFVSKNERRRLNLAKSSRKDFEN